MKKFFWGAALLGCFLMFSCANNPAPAPVAETRSNEPAAEQPIVSQPPARVERVYAPERTAEQPEPAAQVGRESRRQHGIILDGAETHTVVSGDTLSHISRDKYNSGFYFPIIMLASRDIVSDPDRIMPGMPLTIPDLQVNLESEGAREAIKAFFNEVAALYEQRGLPAFAQNLRRIADSL